MNYEECVESLILQVSKLTSEIKVLKDENSQLKKTIGNLNDLSVQVESICHKINDLSDDQQTLSKRITKIHDENRERSERKINKAIREYSLKNNPQSPIQFIPHKPLSSLFTKN